MSGLLRGGQASAVIDACLERATELQCATLTIVVLDASGHRVAVARQDDRWFQVEAAEAKAYAAIALREDTESLGPKLDSSPFWRTIPNLLSGRAGFGLAGVLLRRSADGAILGSVGVIGGSGTQDLSVAHAGASVDLA